MSATLPEISAPPRNQAKVMLRPTAKHPRRLKVELSARNYVYAYLHSKSYASLAIASAQITECYLDISSYPLFLCIGRVATFQLSVTEAAQLRATFEPLGLRIRETQS